jgi:hypothetical protein
MKRTIITHKTKIPEYNDKIYGVDVCNSQEPFPSGITPSLWYKMDALTATSNTNNRNTVNSGEYDRFFNFGTTTRPNNCNLDYKQISNSEKWQQPAELKNFLTTAKSRSGVASWMIYTSASGTDFSSAGVGTTIMAWRSGASTLNQSGNIQFQARNANNQSSGFLSKFGSSADDKTTIFGDNQTYKFTTPMNTDCIRIVSVQSAGTPLYYKQNGATGSIVSYDTMSGTGTQYTVSLDQTTNNDVNDCLLFEAMYFESALSVADCEKIENYLSKKWCIYW